MHKSTMVNVRAYVDKNVAPLVNWLSSFPKVVTLFSCEGYTKNQSIQNGFDELGVEGVGAKEAYVVFTAPQKSLKQILRYLRRFGHAKNKRPTLEVDFYDQALPLRYSLRFTDQDEMKSFLRFAMQIDKDKAQKEKYALAVV